MKEQRKEISESRKRHFAVSVGVGIVLGAVLGMIFYRENIALYVGVGIVVGAIYGLVGTAGNR
ncbi:MAG TPA: hypothetical protein VM450_00385 [Thermomicrobiales bacterium]|nr:hypothetical protein [Thermomicrobiales bacterium]